MRPLNFSGLSTTKDKTFRGTTIDSAYLGDDRVNWKIQPSYNNTVSNSYTLTTANTL